MAQIAIDGNSLTLESALAIAKGTATAFLPASSREKMQDSRDAVEDVLESKNVVYGINTGFGALSSVVIENEQLETLQENLVRSHACGIGERMEPEKYWKPYIVTHGESKSKAKQLCEITS